MSKTRKVYNTEYAPDSKWETFSFNQPISEAMNKSSGWEAVPASEMNQEGLFTSLMKAPFRIGTDVVQGGYELAKKVPSYFESAKTEVPGMFKTIKEHPGHALGQAGAGFAEMGQKAFNLPHDISQYATERLHLMPENINEMVQMGRMPQDTQQMINAQFGEPEHEGEALLRGMIRNLPEIAGAKGTASFINPMRYTSKNIAKQIIKEGDKQYASHQKMYNKLWDQADKRGINQVPIDQQQIQNYFNTISQYTTPKQYAALEKFINDKTLSNAQKAQSDMGYISRSLEQKARSGSLLDSEKALYSAAKEAEKLIEANMFKDKSGKVHQALKNRYDKISGSYRENVVPYKYNPTIQAYKNQELLPKELTQRLSHGEFAAKKGSQHPELFRPNQIKNALIGIGLASGGGLGAKEMYNYLYGTK